MAFSNLDIFNVMSEKKFVRFSFVLPLRLGVPQAGGEFVMLILICRFT